MYHILISELSVNKCQCNRGPSAVLISCILTLAEVTSWHNNRTNHLTRHIAVSYHYATSWDRNNIAWCQRSTNPQTEVMSTTSQPGATIKKGPVQHSAEPASNKQIQPAFSQQRSRFWCYPNWLKSFTLPWKAIQCPFPLYKSICNYILVPVSLSEVAVIIALMF